MAEDAAARVGFVGSRRRLVREYLRQLRFPLREPPLLLLLLF
tara:strand:+ start:423 stop:548 length:126 start_codon:yes stop_codon:yes gene_type:complete